MPIACLAMFLRRSHTGLARWHDTLKKAGVVSAGRSFLLKNYWCEWWVAVRRRISGRAASAMKVQMIAAIPSLLNRLV